MNSINAMFSRFRRPGKSPSAPQQQQQQQQQPSLGPSGQSYGGSASGSSGNVSGGSPPGSLMPGAPATARVAAKPLFLCKPFVTSQLVKGSFSTIVVLPKYVDQGEWVALNGE